jgi:hypothetical protein
MPNLARRVQGLSILGKADVVDVDELDELDEACFRAVMCLLT